MKLKKMIAFTLMLTMLLPLLCSCSATGSPTPEALVKRYVEATANLDGEELLNCMIPSGGGLYNLAVQMGASMTGTSPEKEMRDEVRLEIANMFGLDVNEVQNLKGRAVIISKEEEDVTATVRALTILEMGKKHAYEEIYFVTSKIGNSWYISNMFYYEPYGYSPTKVMLNEEKLDDVYAELEPNRVQEVAKKTGDYGDSVLLPDGTYADIDAMQATWNVINNYFNDPQSSDHYRLEYYIDETEYAQYHFELFVECYREDLLLRASVATTEAVNGFKNATSNVFHFLFSESAQKDALNIKDAKVAQIIVDYLSNLNLKEQKELIDTAEQKQIIQIGQDGVKTVQNFLSIFEQMLEDDNANYLNRLIEVVEKLPAGYASSSNKLKSANRTLGDVFEFDTNNIRQFVDKLVNASGKTSDGTVKIRFNDDWGVTRKRSFNTRRKSLHTYISEAAGGDVDDALDTIDTNMTVHDFLKSAEGLTWVIGAYLDKEETRAQLAEYELILDYQEEYLTHILESSGCANAEEVVSYVLDKLSQTVAEGVCGVWKEFWISLGTSAFDYKFTEPITDKALEAAFDKLVSMSPKIPGTAGVSLNLNWATLLFDVGTDAAMFLSNADETKLQVWGVEDLYSHFQDTKKQLRQAIYIYYRSPSARNFEKLRWTAEYYALLVKSGSQKVSDILVADSESWLSKITAALQSKEAERLDNINDAKDIPKRDKETVQRLLNYLFP